MSALLAATALAVRLGEPAEIVASVEEAQEKAREIGDPRLLAHVLHAGHLYLATAAAGDISTRRGRSSPRCESASGWPTTGPGTPAC